MVLLPPAATSSRCLSSVLIPSRTVKSTTLALMAAWTTSTRSGWTSVNFSNDRFPRMYAIPYSPLLCCPIVIFFQRCHIAENMPCPCLVMPHVELDATVRKCFDRGHHFSTLPRLLCPHSKHFTRRY